MIKVWAESLYQLIITELTRKTKRKRNWVIEEKNDK